MKIQNTFIAGPGSDQLRNIFYMFGTPTAESWLAFNWEFRFGTTKEQELNDIFNDQELTNFVKYLMVMNPKNRVTASEAMKHKFCAK